MMRAQHQSINIIMIDVGMNSMTRNSDVNENEINISAPFQLFIYAILIEILFWKGYNSIDSLSFTHRLFVILLLRFNIMEKELELEFSFKVSSLEIKFICEEFRSLRMC